MTLLKHLRRSSCLCLDRVESETIKIVLAVVRVDGRRGEVRDSASLSRRGSGGARTEWDGCAIKCVSRCRYRASLLRSTPFLASCATLASAAVPLLLRARLSAHSLAGSCSFSVVQCSPAHCTLAQFHQFAHQQRARYYVSC